MNVTLFSKPDCKQCDFTKREFDKHGIDHVTVDVTVDDAGRQKCIDLGYSSMPVVLVESTQETAHWSGFKMDEIKALAYLEGAPQ